LLADRLTAQLLAGEPAQSVGAVVDRLLAVQAQDPRAARLAIRSRSTGLRASDVDAALARRELVVSTLNRGTLHLVKAEDYPWLHVLSTPQLAASNRTRLGEEGVSPAAAERGVAIIAKALEGGPKTRFELRDLLQSADVPTAGQAFTHVVFLATLRGICVRGPMVAREQAFVLVRDWLPASKPVDRDVALRELGRRYQLAHADSDERDLAKWAGITLGDARRAWGPAPAVDPAPLPAPRLLGGYEEILMGWVSRAWVLGDHKGVVTMNGIFKPIALVKGRAVATWVMPRGRVALAPFAPLPASVTKALVKDADDVDVFLAG
jgi:hypothetical protein